MSTRQRVLLIAAFVSIILLGAILAHAQPAHPINPNTQIHWPPGCQIYRVDTNSCVSGIGGGYPVTGGTLLGSMNFDTPAHAQATLQAINGSVTLYPEWYKQVGDVDDAASFNRARAACPAAGNQCTIQALGLFYTIGSVPVDIASTTSGVGAPYRSFLGSGSTVIFCTPSSPISHCLRVLNGSDSNIGGFSLRATLPTLTTGTASNGSTALTVASGSGITIGQYVSGLGIPVNTTVSNVSGTSVTLSASTTAALSATPVSFSMVRYALNITQAGASTEHVEITTALVVGGQYGIAIGPDTSGDVSHVNIHGTQFSQQGQAAILTGNGSQGNVLDNNCFGCTLDSSNADGFDGRGSSMNFFGGGVDGNRYVDFNLGFASQPTVISGIRSENSSQFMTQQHGSDAAISPVFLENDFWLSTSSTNPCPIQSSDGVTITVEGGIYFSQAANVDLSANCFGHSSTNPTYLILHNVSIGNPNLKAMLDKMQVQTGLILDSSNDQVFNADFSGSTGSARTYLNGLAVKNDESLGGNLNLGGNLFSALAGFGGYSNYALHSLFDTGLTDWPIYPSSPVPTVTTNQATDIFGNVSAEQLVAPVLTAGAAVTIHQVTGKTMLTGHTYQFSFYASGGAGGEVIAAGLKPFIDAHCEAAGSGTFPGSWTLTTTRTYYSGTCSPTSNESAEPYIQLYTSTATIYLSQAQVCEVGVDCGPQIPTTTTAQSGYGPVIFGKGFSGNGVGMVTGPNSGTTLNHVVTYADGNGTTQDSGRLLSSFAAAPANGTDQTTGITLTGAIGPITMNCPSPCTLQLPASIQTGFNQIIKQAPAGAAVTIDPNGNTYDGVTTLYQGSIGVWVNGSGTGYHSTQMMTTIAAALTTTAAASDNVTLNGMVSTGHCAAPAPTNATAAANVATTYISAKASNQVTVSHTATGGMTFDVTCWPY